MICVGIIAYPIAKLLDCLLGEHHPIRYTNTDLKALIELHSYKALQETLEHPAVGGVGLQGYQTKMMQGAIDIQSHFVKEIMIPFERVFSIRIGKKLDRKSAKKILKSGFSRIPVYIKNKHAIIGYLLIKTLVGVDLSEGKTIEELMSDSTVTLRKPLYVKPNEAIGSLLTRFKNGKSHMAIVTNDSMEFIMKKYLNDDGSIVGGSENDDQDNLDEHANVKVLGIVTLEDIIESAFKEEILDEADYDIENEANVNYKLEKSVDQSEIIESTRGKIHDILTEKIENMLIKNPRTNGYRKQSEAYLSSATHNWLEMNELKGKLLDDKMKENADELPVKNKKAVDLKSQICHPEMSKSYTMLTRKLQNDF